MRQLVVLLLMAVSVLSRCTGMLEKGLRVNNEHWSEIFGRDQMLFVYI